METNHTATVVLSRLHDDAAHVVTPAHHSDSLLDGEKTSAALLFSGVFLVLVGITFTTMGWQHYYQANTSFEWTQLLGPILISVGGTFVLTSVYNLCMLSRRPCRQSEEEVMVIPVSDQTSRGHPFVFHVTNQPVVLQGATTMPCPPPAFNIVTQEMQQAREFLPVSGASYEAGYCVDNAAFTAEEDSNTDHRRRRRSMQKTEDEGDSTCSHPPAYETIYPSFQKHNPT